MSIMFPLLIGIAVNLDNFVIGMNMGIRGQKLTIFSNFLIGFTTGVCAFGSTYAARLISGNFLVYTNFIGAVIMIFFGYFCLIKDSIPKNTTDLEKENDFCAPCMQETVFLGFVLAINCIPPSFSAGVMDMSPLYIAFFAALFSCISMHVSNRLGYRLLHFRFIKMLSPASSILLIAIGIIELIV